MIRRGAVNLLSMAVLSAAVTLSGCSSGESSAPTTGGIASSTSSPTSLPGVDTTDVSTSSSSSTSSTSTSSTIPAVEGLDMSPLGLGDALFGAEAENVIAYVRAILGPPSADSGWVDPYAIGAACPGTEVRFVEWRDLSLVFSDESFAGSGIRHFASFRYGPTMAQNIDPYGLRTTDGFGIGTTVSELLAEYPKGELYAGDEVIDPYFEIDAALVAFLTDSKPGGRAVSYLGGYGCGE